MAAALGRNVHALNDADAAAIAEDRLGAGHGVPGGTVLMLTIGTGIGSGLLVDGRLVPNTEFGHIELKGRDAERQLSGVARERRRLRWKAWATEFNGYLARLEAYLWPDLIILGGGVSKVIDKYRYEEWLKSRAPIVPAQFLNTAGIIGAAFAAARSDRRPVRPTGRRLRDRPPGRRRCPARQGRDWPASTACLTGRAASLQVHLLDATYELFRAHFAPRPPRLDPQGQPVGATIGVLENVLYLLRDDGVTHLGCASDHVIESWRNARWPGYKTGAGVDPVLKAQFSLAEDALRALGVVVWPMVEWEADDALGTAAARWADDPSVERVVIMTPDKDMGQCVREDGKVVMYDRRQQKLIDADGVRARFGVSPESIPDFLALVGDSSDGYPGIPGWGKVSAGVVLSRYGHLEDIPERVNAWGSVRRSGDASLREHRAAFLFRELAT